MAMAMDMTFGEHEEEFLHTNEHQSPATYHRLLESSEDASAVQASVIVRTLKTYGTFYAICFLLFEVLRRRYPKLYNIRRWVPKLKCELAQERYDDVLFSWFWRVYKVPDQQIFDQCGLDTLCFIRALRFCRKLAVVGCLNAVLLIPLYATAADSPETAHLTSAFDVINIANLPNESLRFIGTIVSAYIIFLYAMYLLVKEFEWYTHWRHLFLSRRVPRSYAVYVYGIPKEYQSSMELANYFRKCCSSQFAVLEAHVAMDIPKLEKLQSKRDRVIQRLERALAKEEKTGRIQRHWHWMKKKKVDSSSGRRLHVPAIETVESVAHLERKLKKLNREIPRRIRQVKVSNDPRITRMNRMQSANNLLVCSMEELGEIAEHPSTSYDSSNNTDREGQAAVTTFVPQTSSSSTRHRRLDTIFSVEVQEMEDHQSVKDDHDDDDSSFSDGEDSSEPDEEDHEGGQQPRRRSCSSFEMMPPDCRELRHSNQQFTVDDEQRAILSLLVPEHSSLFKTMPVMDEPTIGDEESETVDQTVTQTTSPAAAAAAVDRVPSFREQQSDCAMGRLVIDIPDKMDEEQGSDISNQDRDEMASMLMVDDDDESAETTENAGNVVPPGESDVSGHQDPDEEHVRLYGGYPRPIQCKPKPNLANTSCGTFASRTTNLTAETSSSRLGSAANGLAASVSAGIGNGTHVLQKGTKVAGDTIVHGSKAATEATKKAGSSLAASATAVTEAVVKAASDMSVDSVMSSVADGRQKTVKKVKQVGGTLVKSAVTMVPGNIGSGFGEPRSAGFVVFTNLYAVQAALQMVHHPSPYKMEVLEAPAPGDIFWYNVGMKPSKQRIGRLYSAAATTVLCLFWSIPTAFIASLTEVNSLKQQLDGLNDLIEKYPWLENLLFQLAPMLLLILNEVFLPEFLKLFSTWEGFISSGNLEASLFIKLGAFMIVQTFFVSALSGSIYSEITNLIRNPEEIMNLLSTSLPSQSAYFIQMILASTFLLQGFELLRLYPLACALARRILGPRLTEKERSKKWGVIYALEDPPDFWHAETFAQVQILFVMIFFVYAVIAPITTFVILFCLILMESGFRYQFMHNYPVKFDTGGKLWHGFLQFILASMLIAQVTLVGLLLLKQSKFAGPAIGPLIVITILFVIYINSNHSHVTRYLPSRDCVARDQANAQAGNTDFCFVKDEYLQPAFRKYYDEPEYPSESESEYPEVAAYPVESETDDHVV